MADESVLDLFGGRDPPSRRDYVLSQGFTRDPVYSKGVLPDAQIGRMNSTASRCSHRQVRQDVHCCYTPFRHSGHRTRLTGVPQKPEPFLGNLQPKHGVQHAEGVGGRP